MIALPLHVYSSLIASQNEEFSRYDTFQTPAASRRTISRAARSCSSAERVPNFFGAGRRLGASLLIKRVFLEVLIIECELARCCHCKCMKAIRKLASTLRASLGITKYIKPFTAVILAISQQ